MHNTKQKNTQMTKLWKKVKCYLDATSCKKLNVELWPGEWDSGTVD